MDFFLRDLQPRTLSDISKKRILELHPPERDVKRWKRWGFLASLYYVMVTLVVCSVLGLLLSFFMPEIEIGLLWGVVTGLGSGLIVAMADIGRMITYNKRMREAGTGPSATRPESDSERSDKPQPESVRRSR